MHLETSSSSFLTSIVPLRVDSRSIDWPN